MYTTYQEICDQYNAVQNTVSYMEKRKQDILDFFQGKSSRPLLFIGSGSSYFLSQSGEFMAKIKLGVNAASLPAGDLMLNFRNYGKLLKNSIVIAISRSGMTSEILNSITEIKKAEEISVVALCCAEDSTLSKMADLSIEIPWAFDNSVCQTRSVSNLFTVMTMLLSYFANDDKTISEIKAVSKIGNDFRKANEPALKRMAEKPWDNAVVLADGTIQGLAMEAALAFKEISNVPSNYYHLLDVRHGPIVLADSHTLFVMRLMGQGASFEKQLVADVKKTGAMIVALTDGDAAELTGVDLNIPTHKKLGAEASGLLFIYLAQILSYYKALQKGLNPDAPHDLDPWIKL